MDIGDQISRQLEKSNEINHEYIIGCFSTVFKKLEEIYSSINPKSMVIALYNFFEHQMKTLCIEVNKLLPADVSDRYFRDVSIKNYRKFLRREAGFDIIRGVNLDTLGGYAQGRANSACAGSF